MGESAKKVGWGILWFLLMMFIAWPCALAASSVYLIIMVVVVCLGELESSFEVVHGIMLLPGTCVKHMLAGTPMCSCARQVLHPEDMS